MLSSMESGVSVVFEKEQHVVAPVVIQLAGLHGLDRHSYRPPVTTACKPRISPGSAIRTIKVLPSRDVVESLARPWQRIKTPHGLCPSTRTTACSGKTAACFILLNASIDSWERSQKKLLERRWQFRQLSTQFKPDTLIGAPPSSTETRVRQNGIGVGEQCWPVSKGLKSSKYSISRSRPDRPLRKVMTECLHAGRPSILGPKLNACSKHPARR